ncbi:MAG TPA: CehA/McbA family metallohydrolase [Cyclobacteriaceae bacterium]
MLVTLIPYSLFNFRIITLSMFNCIFRLTLFLMVTNSFGQVIPQPFLPVTETVDPQPLIAQAIRISEALASIGSVLPPEASAQLAALKDQEYTQLTVERIQSILDPYCLTGITINPEARVAVEQGPAKPLLTQEGWTNFLVKVYNQGNVTGRLEVSSPNARPILHVSTFSPRVMAKNELTPGEIDNRFLEILLYRDRPMKSSLSGLKLEYAIIQIYTRQKGKREARIGFNVGHGTQDLAFRNAVDILFESRPSVKVVFNIKDFDGQPTMASLLIRDGIERLKSSAKDKSDQPDYRLTTARKPDWLVPTFTEGDIFMYDSILPTNKKLTGIYPLPARRSALMDEYPDFFFQPQVYRYDGEHVFLPPGEYMITAGRGPEYQPQQMNITVPEGAETHDVEISLKRWIHMAELGWYSGDHHIHAAGCSHYESPEEGVKPEHMWRQIQGEDLNMGNNLSWGPCWYYQKEFFTGALHPLSDSRNILRYDVEVSGFPSSHAGHVVLLNLREDDYPNADKIEDWPSWTLPVLKWAKDQGGLTGYAHSGFGLAPVRPTNELPNYVLPKMDGIGANEYVVTLTHNVVDFYSLGNTPPLHELNMLYHTLNSGFRTRMSGETDFPCVTDERVGQARIYAELENGLNFPDFMAALRNGRSYVSDGFSHLIDFTVNNTRLGTDNSELHVKGGSPLKIAVKAAAFLEPEQDPVGRIIAGKPLFMQPFWHIERARKGQSRNVNVELIVNGNVAGSKAITADGDWNDLIFDYRVEKSAWIAVRVFPSSHTNPIFVTVDEKPVMEEKSVEWCLRAVDQCWKEKKKQIRTTEMDDARAAYDHARNVYSALLKK